MFWVNSRTLLGVFSVLMVASALLEGANVFWVVVRMLIVFNTLLVRVLL